MDKKAVIMDNYLLFVGGAVQPFVCLDRRSLLTINTTLIQKGSKKNTGGDFRCDVGDFGWSRRYGEPSLGYFSPVQRWPFGVVKIVGRRFILVYLA